MDMNTTMILFAGILLIVIIAVVAVVAGVSAVIGAVAAEEIGLDGEDESA